MPALGYVRRAQQRRARGHPTGRPVAQATRGRRAGPRPAHTLWRSPLHTSRLVVPLLALAVAGGVAAPALAATSTVTEANLGADWNTGDTRTGGTLAFTTQHGAPAGFGTGSLQLSTTDGAAKVQMLTGQDAGVRLADVKGNISYWAKQVGGRPRDAQPGRRPQPLHRPRRARHGLHLRTAHPRARLPAADARAGHVAEVGRLGRDRQVVVDANLPGRDGLQPEQRTQPRPDQCRQPRRPDPPGGLRLQPGQRQRRTRRAPSTA